jgi:hypothetical protein
LESQGRQLQTVRQKGEEVMENHPANIFLAAVISLVVCSGLMMGVFFLDFFLCDRQCLIPDVDIEEAHRTINYLTDDQDLERM